ncbi:hypothetical protein HK100_008076, partial [Physocladia obscura]
MSLQAVWYRLVLPNGNILDPDLIQVPADSLVVHLKKAIKVENANALKDVDSSALKPYKNQASFDAKVALEVDDAVGGLGRSKAEAVVIVVPIKTTPSPSREASSSTLFATTKRAKYLSDMREDGVSGTLCLDSADDVVAKSLTQYLALGKLLENDLCVTKVIAWLNEVHNAKVHDSRGIPFAFLEGSSGKGKTQTAFALISKLQSLKLPVMYLLFNKPTLSFQPIYRNFKSISSLFYDCVLHDEVNYSGNESPGFVSLTSKSLYTFGFIALLLNRFKVSNAVENFDELVEVKALDYSTVLNILSDSLFISNPPTFIIDECSFDEKAAGRFRFIRNIFRTLGLRLVMLGTDGRAAMLMETMGKS